MDITTLQELPKTYEPKEVEARWTKLWEQSGVFHADAASSKPPYSIACPPPNVTGSLHIGHAVNGTIQDVLARTKRMQGHEVLWQPGTDHAGISTQFVVERKVYKEEKKSRHELGREEFMKRVWAWKEESGNAIHGQYKRLGASMDYDRWRFTMEEGYSRAVRKAFVLLYNKGYVYRGNRMINWCPRCQTSLSDLEVAQKELNDKLYYVKYGELVVATVRPETMLGDTAVAVNPNDDRYKAYVGTQVPLPLTNRTIPVIADDHVEVDFGTGALKITPAHDPNDYEIGLRHGLPVLNTLTPKGVLNELAAPYEGLDRFKARTQIVADLEAGGHLVKVEDYTHNVGHCDRCSTVLEPYLSDQWFVKMEELAKGAIRVVESGEVKFHPERWSGVYLDWMRNVRDWNISRQLWWGHQIPIWTTPDGRTIAAEDEETARQLAGTDELTRDPDVLDTWFSSALWTFATLGWPEDTAELRKFHPTNVLSTARDIIYLWVARMIFSGLEFQGEIPFHDVIIHATILDPEGRRMSKSKGTGVDPLVIIDKYGADACRFWMAGAGTASQDVRFREEKIETYRNFANKLWNAVRFAFMKAAPEGSAPPVKPAQLDSAVDRWIISRLHGVIASVTRDIETYDFASATQTLYEFTWNELCDWYLELAKPRLDAGDEGVRWVLREVLDSLLRLLHPFMPFITEELFQALAARGWVQEIETLQRAEWPKADPTAHDPAAEREVALLIDVVRTVRNVRAELKIEPAKLAPEIRVYATDLDKPSLEASASMIARLARAERVEVASIAAIPTTFEKVATGVAGDCQIHLPLEGFGDVVEKEIQRLGKEQVALEAEQQRVAGQLSNETFVAKAPAAVVEKLRARQDELKGQLETVRQTLEKWR
ncbi:MAG: valine--tRNA ligase [Cyanobacteria bacterium RYN_339]|nr:valine--tRNA ligase [Cyanobacteria bacterium RYN_339]